MPTVDVIILSLVADKQSYAVTEKCIHSYLNTASDLIQNIFVVETNKGFAGDYGDRVTVIKPDEEFNYNRFYNIALERCTADYIVGPNNDIEVQPGCLQKLVESLSKNEADSLCPIDRNWHRHTKMFLPTDNKVYLGYDVSLHMFGPMFCCKRDVFKSIGYLDEQFYFFYQDNDYACSLKACGLKHGCHTGALIKHISGNSDRIAGRKFKYTPENMHLQGELFKAKWYNEPFCCGGYKPYKIYDNH